MAALYTETDKFVLSSSVRVVKGANRSVLVDYLRTDVRIISNDYAKLIELLDRNTISFVEDIVGEDSKRQFHTFLEFMTSNEFGFITDDVSLFPVISDEIHDDHVALIDTIIEVEEAKMDTADFEGAIKKIDELNCADLQLRILSEPNVLFVTKVMDIVRKTRIPYVELHLMNDAIGDLKAYEDMIINYPTLTNICVYEAENAEVKPIKLEKETYYPLQMGQVHYRKGVLNDSCCGVINFENLSFRDTNSHNLMRNFNGCLYKKLTIDVNGNIKNCPSIAKSYGHHRNSDIKTVMNTSNFKQLGMIKKDDIKICQDCEFRYNCTDCRAFVTDDADIYSKPLKCGYNPYTNEWQEWSTSELRKYEQAST
jgi:SPASM domain peptide maturase of grasp-with-spasm system